ncbi:GntR family transcriptional regulator [Streptosporangium roseum]|uniref:GntR family transcriptional regulator n=1 Tax=Streptosporangium roseum TaxID=2001 RepID=UPI0004CCD7E2|nr:GntR family transcriptional regulator [Streptosporangium roseum]
MSKLGFREIAAAIRVAIVSGEFPTGTSLPSEPELAERYGGGASRSLVNRAMQLLAAEGLVRPRQGRGTIVTWLPPLAHSPARYARDTRERSGAKGAFDSEVRALGLEPVHEITVEHATPPEEIAGLLGLVDGQAALVRRRRLLASGIPVRINASWIPLEIAEGTVLEEPGPVIVGGIKTALAGLGHTQTEATERIIVRTPTEEEVTALEISPERSVLDIVHVGRTAGGRAVEVTTTVTPAHYLAIETAFPLS